MSATTTRKSKTITTPEFTCGRGPIKAIVREQIVTLKQFESDGEPISGYYAVYVEGARCLPVRIGTVQRVGSGWTARFANDQGAGPSFTGDHFPARTGKQTRTYALCYLIARVVGFSSSDATYNLEYAWLRV